MIPKTSTLRLPFLLTALAAASGPIAADKIVKTDGSVIENVTIEEESLLEVVYKQERNRRTVPSDEVLAVEFGKMPQLVDEAMAFAKEGDLLGALANLDAYVDAQIEKPSERRMKWAPAFAAWKAVELRLQVGDLGGAQSAAGRLIDHYDDSRYVPLAYLAKADVELWSGSAPTAQKTLEKLSKLIEDGNLAKRFRLECRLSQALAAKTSGDEKRKELALIVTEAGDDLPIVRSRAHVASGETFLTEAAATRDQAKARKLRDQGREVFQGVVDDPLADDATLAGAYTGLGDCLFYIGADTGDAEVLKQASLDYLRVVTLYEEQGRYVPKALFYAMRCFDLMQDRGRKRDMRNELVTLYPNSRWTEESQKF